MARLIIAEKPSVARDLAKVLGVKGRGRGALEGNGWVVTWCVGHLVELVEPHEYKPTWKRWELPSLPMLPRPFKLRPVARTLDQFELVKRLLLRKDITEVINACDAGREGELIFRYVYYLAGATAPIRRLWISSMTDEAIKKGFDSLASGEDYERLWLAARCRSEADWLVGINCTRAITVKARESLAGGRELFSVGRVQTPTLAMLVMREREILAFEPKDYFQVKVELKAETGSWKAMWFRGKAIRFDTEEEAQAVATKVDGKTGVISKVDKKKGKERPPFLFDLTKLQRTANKRYGFSAARTLTLAQALYEKHKLLTYPRTDSSHLSKDMIGEMPKVFRALQNGPYQAFADHLLHQVNQKTLPTHKRIFDDKKVSDHHGIIPTPRRANLNRLDGDERRLYDLVARRFLAAFYPDALFERTQVVTLVEGETFRAKGKVYTNPGWRTVMGFQDDGGSSRRKKKSGNDDEKDDENQGLLPPLNKGDAADVTHTDMLKKQTRPPARYTEATLLAAMEGAGRLLDDDELQAAMKDSGLGTPATRASTIETLLSRGYMHRKGKSLVPLEKGMQLIEVIPDEGIKSPQLTGEWEARLAQMARGGGEDADHFMGDVSAYVSKVIQAIKTTKLKGLVNAIKPEDRGPKDPADAIAEGSLGPCPTCGGAVLEKTKVFVCEGPKANGKGCGFRIFKTVAKKKLSPTMAKTLLTKGKTKLLKGFTARSGRSFDAMLKLEDGGRITFEFPERTGGYQGRSSFNSEDPRPGNHQQTKTPTRPSPVWICPQCGIGKILKGRTAYGCGRWRDGCDFRIPFQIDGKPLKGDDLHTLLTAKNLTRNEKPWLELSQDGDKLRLKLVEDGDKKAPTDG